MSTHHTLRAGELQRATQERFFALFVRTRFFVAPAVATVAVLAALEGPGWRTGALLAAAAVVVALSTFERFHYRRDGTLAFGVTANLLTLLLAQITVITCVGGLGSPLMASVVGFGIMAGLFGTDVFRFRIPLLLQVPWLFALGWVQSRGAPPGFTPFWLEGLLAVEPVAGVGPWPAALFYSLLVIAAPNVGRSLRGVIADAYADVNAARERELTMHRTQREELTALTGELAHDLKNPLASLVGVGVLLERAVAGGEPKAKRHVEVLRTEVDRMRSVVDELLDFSRPLVPLDLEEHDLAELVREVAALHEGVGEARGARFELDLDQPAYAAFDERKIRSAVVNLVQNALDANAEGGTVALQVRTEGDTVVFRCADEGPGLDERVADRVFGAGVTTKREGSGLGLTIARTAIEQHGGTLELTNREGTGALATIRLPRRPPKAAA